MRPTGIKVFDLVIAAGVAFAAALAVAPAASQREFVLDAEYVVRDNPRVREARYREILDSTWWGDDREESISLYRPLTMTWFAAIAAATRREGEELDPRPFARGNVLLHALVAALRYALLLALLAPLESRRVVAAAAAVLAGVHGISAESVVGVVGAAELLATAFVTASWIATAAAVRARGVRGGALAAVAAVAWLGALASKESAVLFPVVVAAHALLLGDGAIAARARRAAAMLIPFVIAGAIWLVRRHAVTGDWLPTGEGVWGGFETTERIASALAATVSVYAAGTVWPFDLAPNITHQDVPPAAGFADVRAVAGSILWVAVLAGTVFASARRRVTGLLGIAGVAAFLPTANLLVGIGAVAAHRFFYAPLFFVAGAAALGADALTRRRRGAGLAAWGVLTAAGIVGFAGARGVVADWESSESLYAAAYDANPRCIWALQNLVLARHFAHGVPAGAAAEAAIADCTRFDDVEDSLAVIPSSGRLDLATRVHAYKLLYNRAGLWSRVGQGATMLRARVEASTHAAGDLSRAERYAWNPAQVFEARVTLFNMRLLELRNAADDEEREILYERAAFALEGVRRLEGPDLAVGDRVKLLVAEADLATVRGDAAHARVCLDRALAADPADPDLRRQLAERALQQGDVAGALGHLDAAISGGRAPMMTYSFAAQIAARAQKTAACRRYLEAGLARPVTQPGEWELRRQMTAMMERVR